MMFIYPRYSQAVNVTLSWYSSRKRKHHSFKDQVSTAVIGNLALSLPCGSLVQKVLVKSNKLIIHWKQWWRNRILYFTGSGQKYRNWFCGKKSFMVFQSAWFSGSQTSGFKIVNKYFFTHFHKVLVDRKSKTTILPTGTRKHRRRNSRYPYRPQQITTRPHLSCQGFSLQCHLVVSVMNRRDEGDHKVTKPI